MTTKGTILKEIRIHCLECCGGSTKEVELCPVKCSLKLFRRGVDPTPARRSNFHKTGLTEGEFLDISGLERVRLPSPSYLEKKTQ